MRVILFRMCIAGTNLATRFGPGKHARANTVPGKLWQLPVPAGRRNWTFIHRLTE